MKTSFVAVFVFLASLVMASVLLSNKGGINIRHTHTASVPSSVLSIGCKGWITKKCTVFLGPNIVKPYKYKELVTLLATAGSSDKITISLTGNGGYVSSALMLYYAINNSKANVTMIVVGDVYSAHALLALAGNRTVINSPFSIVMFHRSSLYSIPSISAYCKDKYGKKTDRLQSSAMKCVVSLNALMIQDRSMIALILSKALTSEQLKRLEEGHDIYLFGHELRTRLDNKKEVK